MKDGQSRPVLGEHHLNEVGCINEYRGIWDSSAADGKKCIVPAVIGTVEEVIVTPPPDEVNSDGRLVDPVDNSTYAFVPRARIKLKSGYKARVHRMLDYDPYHLTSDKTDNIHPEHTRTSAPSTEEKVGRKNPCLDDEGASMRHRWHADRYRKAYYSKKGLPEFYHPGKRDKIKTVFNKKVWLEQSKRRTRDDDEKEVGKTCVPLVFKISTASATGGKVWLACRVIPTPTDELIEGTEDWDKDWGVDEFWCEASGLTQNHKDAEIRGDDELEMLTERIPDASFTATKAGNDKSPCEDMTGFVDRPQTFCHTEFFLAAGDASVRWYVSARARPLAKVFSAALRIVPTAYYPLILAETACPGLR